MESTARYSKRTWLGLVVLCLGAAVVFLSSVSPQRIVEAFHKHRITSFGCVPQFFYVLLKRIFSQVAAQPFPMRKLFWLMYRIAGSLPKPESRACECACWSLHPTIPLVDVPIARAYDRA